MSAHAQTRATARRRPTRRRARTQRRRLGLLAFVIGLAVVALLSLKPWADKAVRVASNLTDAEALKLHVIDLLAPSLPALLEKIEQVVRLIRSKGVGVYFVSQSPLDIPDSVLGQLGNRVQHALRAFTPRDQKAVKAAAALCVPHGLTAVHALEGGRVFGDEGVQAVETLFARAEARGIIPHCDLPLFAS